MQSKIYINQSLEMIANRAYKDLSSLIDDVMNQSRVEVGDTVTFVTIGLDLYTYEKEVIGYRLVKEGKVC